MKSTQISNAAYDITESKCRYARKRSPVHVDPKYCRLFCIQAGCNATTWTNECQWMSRRKWAHLLPSLTDGWNRQLKDNPEVTHLACLSGLSNSEGQRWEQNKKKKEGTVLSQAGRARHVTEPSVRSIDRDFFFVTRCWWEQHEHQIFFFFFFLKYPEVAGGDARWEQA